MHPLVSIIIPTHNRSHLIAQTVESVFAQTYANLEICLIDDHSGDATAAVCESLAHQDQRFRYFKLPDGLRGAPSARNFGMDQCAGEFVLFLDSDDLLTPRALEDRVAKQLNQKEDTVIVTKCIRFKNQPLDDIVLWNDIDTAASTENLLSRFLLHDVPFQTSCSFWPKELLKRLNLRWNESLAGWQDWQFHVEAILKGVKYQVIENIDVLWRIHSSDSIGRNSFSLENNLSKIDMILELIEKYKFDEVDKSKLEAIVFYLCYLCRTKNKNFLVPMRKWKQLTEIEDSTSPLVLGQILLLIGKPKRKLLKNFGLYIRRKAKNRSSYLFDVKSKGSMFKQSISAGDLIALSEQYLKADANG